MSARLRTCSSPARLPSASDQPKQGDLMIRRPATLLEQARAALREAILDLRLQPGQRLTESMLCRLTGVSRTVVREALRYLESEGLVEHVPGRGAFVTDFSADDIRHCYEIYGAVEERAARAFAQRAGSGAIAKLKSAFDDLQSARRARGTNQFLDRINSFHDVLLNECANPLVQQVANPVNGRVKHLRAILLSTGDPTSYSLSELAQIVDAMERRDAERAEASTRRCSISECAAVLSALRSS